jgi:hypothetical protein
MLAYLDEKNISDLEEGDYFQMDDGQWCLYRTDVYCNCEGCSENFMANGEDDKGGYCGECYMCADCGCKCDEEESEEEVDDIDAPNIYPYKKCSVCQDRSSCGNYNSDKKWICEGCEEVEKAGIN